MVDGLLANGCAACFCYGILGLCLAWMNVATSQHGYLFTNRLIGDLPLWIVQPLSPALLHESMLRHFFWLQPPHKVNLTTPSKSILVQLLKSSCALAVADDYRAHAKFNIKELCGLGTTGGPKPSAAGAAAPIAAEPEAGAEPSAAKDADAAAAEQTAPP